MTLKTSTLPGVSLADATWIEETKTGFRDWKTVGRGACSAHHGEILQGMFEDNGKLHRALISVPFGHLTSAAKFQPDETINTIVVEPGHCVKARAAAELTLRKCGRKHGGYLTLSSNIPERIGLGSSTADVVATIEATVDGCGVELSSEEIAEFAVAAEISSDSSMFGSRAVLFAQREGFVLEYFSGEYPHLCIVGFNTDPNSSGVDTLALPPATYTVKEIMSFQMLRALTRRAIKDGSAALLGRVASSSARINNSHLKKKHFNELERLVEAVGAVGMQVAHSGTIAGVIFDPATAELSERLFETNARLAELYGTETWCFEVGSRSRRRALAQ
jgi:uncharacterized protein involved in propanediol utilization